MRLRPVVVICISMVVSPATLFAAAALTPEATQQLRQILDAPPPNPKEHNSLALAGIYLQRS